jgi:hypothetical protein
MVNYSTDINKTKDSINSDGIKEYKDRLHVCSLDDV